MLKTSTQNIIVADRDSWFLRNHIWKYIIGACLLPFFLLSFFNHPVYDDYVDSSRTIRYGFWEVQKVLYNGWTGRYFSSLFLTITNPLSYGWIAGVKVTVLVFMTGILGGFYLVFRWLTKGLAFQKNSIWYAAALLLAYLGIMPSVFEGFFWYVGAAVYQTGNMLLIAVLLASYKFLTALGGSRKMGWAVLGVGGMLAAAATNEIVLSQLLAAFGLFFLISLYRRTTSWRWWLFIAFVGLAGAALSLTAPGNFVRMDSLHVENSRSLAYALPRTFISAVMLVSSVPLGSVLLIFFCLWLPLGVKIAETKRLYFLDLHPIVAAASIFAVLCLCYFPFWWLSASYTPLRTENSIVFFLLVSWVIAVQAGINWWYRQRGTVTLFPRWVRQYMLPVLGLLILLRIATMPAYLELALNARQYNALLNDRYRYIQQQKAAGKKDIVVTAYPLKYRFAILTDGTDITTQTQAEQNRYYAEYFGLNSIRLATPDQQ
jgi:Family of unknown function (DUF6056)